MSSPRIPTGRGLAPELLARFERAFGGAPGAAARGPGRLNAIGEHTDYSGGLVLPAAISLETRVAARLREDRTVRADSREKGAARAELGAPASGAWLDYVRGVARMLAEAGRMPERGFELAIESDVPVGAGLSSSAALGVATAHALAGAAGAPFGADECETVARLCHRAESEFVGIPCGIMDPYASACGREGSALLLDCATLRAELVPIPSTCTFLVVDTGVRRELRAGGYEDRVRECARARDAAGRALGRELAQLSELDPDTLAAAADALDPVALARARHVTSENARVRDFAAALAAGDLEGAGALLFASHESLARDFEVSWPEADRLVAASRELSRDGVLGARMMGGGFGGCTLHLVRADAAPGLAKALAGDLLHWELAPARGGELLGGGA